MPYAEISVASAFVFTNGCFSQSVLSVSGRRMPIGALGHAMAAYRRPGLPKPTHGSRSLASWNFLLSVLLFLLVIAG